MPQYFPEPIWKGQEAFIIGGGDSLREHNFDWNLLKEERTIGCNSAFRLGPEICDVCVFADRKFFKSFYKELEQFPNPIVTNDTQLRFDKTPWLNWMIRKIRGLHIDALGYNANCGAIAINLALLYGATTIYLLGFDMKLSEDGRPNWHDYLIDKPSDEIYTRMLGQFGNVSKDLRDKFPDRKVYNVTHESKLEVFPKINFDQFWSERTKVQCLRK